jgi:hypothetical protein
MPVGIYGNITAGEYIRSTVHQFVSQSGISNFSVEQCNMQFAKALKM